LSQQTAGGSCAGGFLTVLDFGHPTRKYAGNDSPLDDYAMTLFGYRDTWRTFREVEQLAERYLDAWFAAVSPCPRLHLALGTNNYDECWYATGACDITTASRYWDVVVHDVMDYATAKGYDQQVTGIWAGDDLETSWDSWATTARFLNGVVAQEQTYDTHARLVDYGDAKVGVCSVVTGSCRVPWTADNVYAAAWGIGWDAPLPEVYSPDTAQRWESVAQTYPAMEFMGVMTECAGADPLPLDGCQADRGADPSPSAGLGACEWAPSLAYNYAQSNDPRRPLAYATNIQWPTQPTDTQTNTAVCG
jgi:hypothetical protein